MPRRNGCRKPPQLVPSAPAGTRLSRTRIVGALPVGFIPPDQVSAQDLPVSHDSGVVLPLPSLLSTPATMRQLRSAPVGPCLSDKFIHLCSSKLQTCSTPFELEMLQTVPLLAAAQAVRMQRAALGSNGGFKPSEYLQDLAAQRAAAHQAHHDGVQKCPPLCYAIPTLGYRNSKSISPRSFASRAPPESVHYLKHVLEQECAWSPQVLYFAQDEYDSASALLKLKKSAGVDLITSEVVQSLGDSARAAVLTLFNQIEWPLASRLDIEPSKAAEQNPRSIWPQAPSTTCHLARLAETLHAHDLETPPACLACTSGSILL